MALPTVEYAAIHTKAACQLPLQEELLPGAAAARLLQAISTAILHPEVPTGRLPATPSRVHSMVAGVHQTRFKALRVAGVKYLTVFT